MTVCTEMRPSVLHIIYCLLSTFRHILSVPSWRVKKSKNNTFLGCLTLEGRTYRLPRKLSKWLPVNTVHYPRIAKTSFMQRRKPVVTHVKECLLHLNNVRFNILISMTFRHWYIDDGELVAINRVWALVVDKFHQYQSPDVLTSAHAWSTTIR
jgi:hypothetical protein